MTSTRCVCGALAVVAFVFGSHAAFAQTAAAPPRAPQGLFGALGRSETAPNRLDLTASVIEGYDTDVPGEFRQTITPSTLVDGFSTIFSTTADYARTGTRAQLAAAAAAAWRYYNDLDETRSAGYSAGLGASFRVGSRTTLLVNQAAAYLPTYFYGLFPTGVAFEPGAAPPVAQDFAANDLRSYSYSTNLSLGHQLTGRSSFALSGEYQYVDRLDEHELWRDVAQNGAEGRYSYDVGRNTALTASYRYRSGEYGYGGDGKATEHAVNVGFTYTKLLSPTRRAVFSVAAGPSSSDIPRRLAGDEILLRQYQFAGDVSFSYDFGRSWRARANYRRGLEYVVDLPEPTYADSVGASVSGLFGRRVDFSFSAGYSRGESLIDPSTLLFDTYTGDLRLRYALTRHLATYVEYLYYYYDFRQGTQLLAGMPRGLERNAARVGLTLWVPAMGR